MKELIPQSVLKGTTLLFIGRTTNRVFGLVREVLAASFFGTGWAMDCYNLSFTIATSLRQLFAERFFIPLIPTYFQQKRRVGDFQAIQTLSSITTRLNLLAIFICIGLFAWAHQLVQFVAPGFDDEQIRLSAVLVRWFSIGGIGFILHRYYTGLYTCFFQYTIISFAPILLNIGAIIGIVFFSVKLGIVSLASGVSLGFLAYLFVIIFFLPHRNKILAFRWGRGDTGISDFRAMMTPLFLIGGIEQIQIYVDRALASGLSEGALSAQGYALRIMHMFLEFFVGTFGTAIFPVFSSLAASEKSEDFARHFALIFQIVMLALAWAGFLVIPLALPIIRVLLERGAFTFEDSVLTAQLMIYYAGAFIAQALLIVLFRGFHSHGDTRTPMLTTFIAVSVMICGDFILVGPMGIHGLALAQAIGFGLNLAIIYILFTRYLGRRYSSQILKVFSLVVFLALTLGWLLSQIWGSLEASGFVNDFLTRLIWILLLSGVATSIYFLILYRLHLEAVEYFLNRIRQKRTKISLPHGNGI